MQAFGGLFLLLLMLPHGITWSEGTWVKVQEWFMGSQSETREDDQVEVLWGIPDVETVAGRLLTYTIPHRAFTGPVSEFQVYEVGHQQLPVWLEFDQTSQTFRGVPTSSDQGLVHIEVTAHSVSGPRTPSDLATSTFYIKIISEVNSHRQDVNQLPKGCELSDHIIKAHIILNVELESLTAKDRIGLLDKLARFLSLRVSDINLGPKMKDSTFKLMDETVLMAGPGDGIDVRTYERTTLSWVLGCEDVTEYSVFASVIEHNIQGGRLLQELGHSSQGWYVTVTELNSHGGSRLNRRKRQAHGGRTPVPTPTVISAVPSRITTHLSQQSKSFTRTQSSWSDIVPTRTLPTTYLTMIHTDVHTMTDLSTREVSSSLSSSEIPRENSRSAVTESAADSIATLPVMDSSELVLSTLSPSFLSDISTEMLLTQTSSNIVSTLYSSFMDSLHSGILSTISTSVDTSFLMTDSEFHSVSNTLSHIERPTTIKTNIASTIQPTRIVYSTSHADETNIPAVLESSYMDQNISAVTMESTVLITGSLVSPAESGAIFETANLDLTGTVSPMGSMNTVTVHPSDVALSTYADTQTVTVHPTDVALSTYADTQAVTVHPTDVALSTYADTQTVTVHTSDVALSTYADTQTVTVHPSGSALSTYAHTQTVTVHPTDSVLSTYADTQTESVEMLSPSVVTGYPPSMPVTESGKITSSGTTSLFETSSLKSENSSPLSAFSISVPSYTGKTSFLPGTQRITVVTSPSSSTGLPTRLPLTSFHAASTSLLTNNLIGSLPSDTLLQTMTELSTSTLQKTIDETFPSSTLRQSLPSSSNGILPSSTVQQIVPETSSEIVPLSTLQQSLSEISTETVPFNTIQQTFPETPTEILPSGTLLQTSMDSTFFLTPSLIDENISSTLTPDEVSTVAQTNHLTLKTTGFIPTVNGPSVIPTVSSTSSQIDAGTSHVEPVVITRVKRTVLVEDMITSSIDKPLNFTSTEIKDTNIATTKVPALPSTGVSISATAVHSVSVDTVFSSSGDMLQTQPPVVPLSSTSSSLMSPPEHTIMASQVDVETLVDSTSNFSSVRTETTVLTSSFATSSFGTTPAAINTSLEPAVLTTIEQVTTTHDIEYSTRTTMAQTPVFTSVTAGPTTPLIPTDPPNQAPKLVNPIGQINITLGKYSQVKIPKSTFIDPDKSINGSLKLMLFTAGGEKLPPDSWVQFNDSTNVIHFLPIDESIAADKQGLVLVAQDLGGLSASEYIRINIDTSEALNVSHSFIIKMTTNFAAFSSSIFNAVNFMTVLSNYFGQNSPDYVVVTDLSNGSTVFTYSNTTLSKSSCDNETILHLFSKLSDEGSGVSPEFAKYVFPDYSISSVKLKWQGVCVDSVGLVVPPVSLIVNETSLASVLVPVLIILFIIPLVLVILVYVYKRRKQKGRYLPEDEKPIILRNRLSGIFNEGLRQDENHMKPMHYVDISESLQPDESNSAHSSPKTSSESLPPYRLPEYANGHHQNLEFSHKSPKKREENSTSASHKPPPAYRLPPLYIPPSHSSQI